MSIYRDHTAFFNEPIRLTAIDIGDPDRLLAEFVGSFHLFELRELLADLIDTALSTDNQPFADPISRADLLFRREQLEQVFEALYIKYGQRERPHQSTSSYPSQNQ